MTCKDCPNRTEDCHIDCEEYAEQQKRFEAIREARRVDSLQRSQNIIDNARRKKAIIKIKKRRGDY